MERKYTILATLLVVLALGLVVLPKGRNPKESDPKVLLSAIAEKSRYLSADQVTHRIIENDPTLLLIDLRPAEQYKIFALPGSLNIHPDSLWSDTGMELLNQQGKDKVLCANSDLLPEKVWLLCARHAIGRIYILKGGMNEWFNTIIRVQPATGTPSTADLDLISFRFAARQFFVGTGESVSKTMETKEKEAVTIARKAPKTSSGGGC